VARLVTSHYTILHRQCNYGLAAGPVAVGHPVRSFRYCTGMGGGNTKYTRSSPGPLISSVSPLKGQRHLIPTPTGKCLTWQLPACGY